MAACCRPKLAMAASSYVDPYRNDANVLRSSAVSSGRHVQSTLVSRNFSLY